MNQPLDLGRTPVHLGSTGTAEPVDGFTFEPASFERYIEAQCQNEPGHLAMIEETPTDWPAWECHPEGDELVFVLSGRATFLQEIDGETREIDVSTGDAIVNPRGVWHTANVTEPLRAIYVTPCPGTNHRPR